MEDIGIQPNEVSSTGHAAFSEGAGLVEFPRTNLLRLTGKDPVGMLGAVLTNEIPRGGNGLGVYAALLSPKGRVQADLRVIGDPTGEGVFIVAGPEGADAARQILGRYAPFSRVKVEDLTSGDEAWRVLGLYGPRAKQFLGNPDLAEHETARTEIGGAPVLVTGVAAPVFGYDVICPSSTLDAVRGDLLEAGAVSAGQDDYETARIWAGIPRFGVDITPDNFPGESESFLQRTVSFEKGCYPGQETVARMRYRGSPNKKLYRFKLGAGSPAAGNEIYQGEDTVGWLTSVTPLSTDGKTFALGYLVRKAYPRAPMKAKDANILAVKSA